MTDALRVLVCGAATLPATPILAVETAASLDAALDAMTRGAPPDALVSAVDGPEAARLIEATGWQPLLRDVAVLLLTPPLDDDLAARLVSAGVQDLLLADEQPSLARRVRHAVLRKRLERDARKAWSTDLNTGLPNRAQLLEHLHQLLALRTRQPAPMAVLAIRIEGLDALAAQRGAEAAQLVRRKVAVRLRAAVRASDVVSSLGGEQFALLLSKIEAPADAQRVALKLQRALREPFNVLGGPVGVTAHLGIAQHPADGSDGEPLLRQAVAAALDAQRRRSAAAND
jgi:diguanylate cyclase (GGDEF)-like protein